MADFTWIEAEERLSNAALTVRAQIIDPTDQDRLLWNLVMPRRDVPTTKITSLTSQELRISADRREWNARGRYINLITPPTKELEWVPIESYFKVEEKEINDLLTTLRGNAGLFRDEIRASIPARTDLLAAANWRRLELDVFEAWSKGQITSKNPILGTTFVTSYGFAGSRYQTAGTAWDNGAVNGYNEFLAWMRSAFEAIGPLQGAWMRLATRNAIVADAPNPMAGAITGLTPTVSQVEQRIQDELGMPFRFYIDERTVQVYTDGGIARTTTNIWPAQRVAAVPAGGRVGSTAFAPVARAYEVSAQAPGSGIDVRGQTVYVEVGNGGRELTVEAQFNPMPDPDEAMMYVINAGV